MEESAKRVLILCVDLDDDIGNKTGLETPIIGRENVLKAAEKLALLDPEEADSNAMFASVKLSDEFSKSGCLTEVCVVSGLKNGGLDASRKAMNEIMHVAKLFSPSDVYVVTDGFGEEDIEPVLKARLPLAGVKRVVVKQSRAIEESYIVLGRYLKMLFTDPRFKRWVLGLGGLLITLLAILSHFRSYYEEVNTVFWSIVGIAILIKGLDLDKWISSGLKQIYGENLPPTLLMFKTLFLFTGASLILFTFYTGYFIEKEGEVFMAILGKFISQTIDIFLLGIALILISGSLKYPLRISNIRDPLSMLVNLLALAPLIKTLGIAAYVTSFDLRLLLYVSILTLVLIYAVNIFVFLVIRFLSLFLKVFKIAIEE